MISVNFTILLFTRVLSIVNGLFLKRVNESVPSNFILSESIKC